MKKLLSITLVCIMLATTIAIANAQSTELAFYGYSENANDSCFSVTNVLQEITDTQYIPGVVAKKCAAPVTITSENELSGFGVSSLIPMGPMYIEGTYLTPDGEEFPFDGETAIPKGKTFTINDIGIYYIWAAKNAAEAPVEAVIVVDSVKANYTNSKVLVNGVEIQFEAYNINNNNYFKLRDIAKALSGTDKQFDVSWDAENSSINLVTGAPYTPAGGELTAGDGIQKDALKGSDNILKDGEYAYPTAYLINNNNYFKLRDLGEMFDFDVSWDGVNNCVIIDTTKSYTED